MNVGVDRVEVKERYSENDLECRLENEKGPKSFLFRPLKLTKARLRNVRRVRRGLRRHVHHDRHRRSRRHEEREAPLGERSTR